MERKTRPTKEHETSSFLSNLQTLYQTCALLVKPGDIQRRKRMNVNLKLSEEAFSKGTHGPSGTLAIDAGARAFSLLRLNRNNGNDMQRNQRLPLLCKCRSWEALRRLRAYRKVGSISLLSLLDCPSSSPTGCTE
jgi:hypothetical protein